MALYLGLSIATTDVKGKEQRPLTITHKGLEDYCFSPILSSSQAVMRSIGMPVPGENVTSGQQSLTISPYHITKSHNWASRHLESTIYYKADTAIDIVIVDLVSHGKVGEGLKPTFIKLLEGVHLASLTREISGDGVMTETCTFIFQRCTHTYISLLAEGKMHVHGEFSYDLNVRKVESGNAELEPSEYKPQGT